MAIAAQKDTRPSQTIAGVPNSTWENWTARNSRRLRTPIRKSQLADTWILKAKPVTLESRSSNPRSVLDGKLGTWRQREYSSRSLNWIYVHIHIIFYISANARIMFSNWFHIQKLCRVWVLGSLYQKSPGFGLRNGTNPTSTERSIKGLSVSTCINNGKHKFALYFEGLRLVFSWYIPFWHDTHII